MNLRKIIIFQHEVLFNILNEINEILNFNLIKIDEVSKEDIEKYSELDTLIISKSEKVQFKNRLVIEEKPIKIDELLELINLKFLKDKFNYQSDISIGSYKLNLNSRKISKNDLVADLTEREINLIIFLKKTKLPVNINELQKKVWEYGSDLDTHTVETHIYRLRKKIKEKFNDEKFILSSKKGYFIDEKK
jgi:hypothetical protein